MYLHLLPFAQRMLCPNLVFNNCWSILAHLMLPDNASSKQHFVALASATMEFGDMKAYMLHVLLHKKSGHHGGGVSSLLYATPPK